MEQLTTARETLRDLAARDPLTGLWNHNSIIELLDSELHRAERQDSCVGVALVDLDHFKSVNDTLGHLVGDRVLRDAAQAISSLIRPYDAVGRYGGEEFLIILPGCDRMNALSHCERLRVGLSNLAATSGEERVPITGSFGVTVVGPDRRVDADAAIHAADSAMYLAKRNGRDRVEYLEPTPAQPKARIVPVMPVPPISSPFTLVNEL